MRLLKNIGKFVIVRCLAWQLKRLRAKNDITVVGVVGSIGKTSTKIAIAKVLGEHFRVRFQDGNYNDIVTVPLIFFGQSMPSLLNPVGWTKVLLQNERQLRSAYPYNVVVVELGTDFPGQIAAFKQYIQLDIAVLTAIAYEHMERFESLQAVADEELNVQNYSKQIIYNADLCSPEYTQAITIPTLTYGKNRGTKADYTISNVTPDSGSISFTIKHANDVWFAANLQSLATPQLYSATAAAVVAKQLGMADDSIARGIGKLTAVSGRMKVLKGIKKSQIIDDSYNSSPSAAQAALDLLYGLDAPQKIALLGDMNELGDFTESTHTELGEYCDPEQLDMVITLGPAANAYTAAAATAKGCKVVTCTSPYEAGKILAQSVQPHAIILIKGSQNNVFAEESIKSLLSDPADAAHLVRQSASWMAIKARAFSDANS